MMLVTAWRMEGLSGRWEGGGMRGKASSLSGLFSPQIRLELPRRGLKPVVGWYSLRVSVGIGKGRMPGVRVAGCCRSGGRLGSGPEGNRV